jgi:hypothetical protein
VVLVALVSLALQEAADVAAASGLLMLVRDAGRGGDAMDVEVE